MDKKRAGGVAPSKPERQKTTSLRLFVAATATIAITVGAGIVHGRLTQRWGVPVDITPAVKRVDAFPREFGSWKLRTEEEMPIAAKKILRCAGDINRSYVNQETGSTVSMALIVGPSGPTSVHDPQICYSSTGVTQISRKMESMESGISPSESGGSPSTFWALTMRPNLAVGMPFRVYYAWSRDGEHWIASQKPRFDFGGDPFLYKLQVVSEFGGSNSQENKKDPARDFLQQLIDFQSRGRAGQLRPNGM